MSKCFAYTEECYRSGIDSNEVSEIAAAIERQVEKLRGMGLHVFGGTGAGTIRLASPDPNDGRDYILAELGCGFDGGDGATHLDEEGLLRGEAGK